MEAKKKKRTTKATKPVKHKSRKKPKKKGLGKVSAPKKKPQAKKTVARTNENWFMSSPVPQKSGAQKIILTTLTIGAAGVVGYLGLQYWKKYKAGKAADLDNELDKIQPTVKEPKLPPIITKPDTPYTPPKNTDPHTGGGSSSRNDNFPLKKGSKGEMVRQMQQALIDKYGSSVLPKYGADGDFGNETLNALKKKGLPVVVTESAFNVLTQGESGSSGNNGLAEQLYKGAQNKSFSSVISLLKKINNKDQYQQVSNSFMQLRLKGVRQTLVNGMLSSFTDEGQKQHIRMEFIRMGLQYRNNKFSLSGFDGKPLVTKAAATVWTSPTESIQVPALMVIGNEVTTRLDYTLFENNGKYFLIKTEAVKYL